jgi:hypothetical protein
MFDSPFPNSSFYRANTPNGVLLSDKERSGIIIFFTPCYGVKPCPRGSVHGGSFCEIHLKLMNCYDMIVLKTCAFPRMAVFCGSTMDSYHGCHLDANEMIVINIQLPVFTFHTSSILLYYYYYQHHRYLSTGFSWYFFSWTNYEPHHSGFKFLIVALSL